MTKDVTFLPPTKQRQPAETVRTDLKARAAALFQDEQAHGASLLIAATRIIPVDELLSLDEDGEPYHPHTLRLELQDELRIKEIDDDIMSRLFAAYTILTTDLFYRSVPAFIEICNTLSDAAPLPGFFDPADSYEMAIAVAQAELIDPLDGRDDMDFSAEVRGYMGMQLADEGYFAAPKILAMAEMPDTPQPTEITDDAELIQAAIASDQSRHADIETAVSLVMQEIKQQLGGIV